MVFIRKNWRKGKVYFSVVETFRKKCVVRQRTLYYIGSGEDYSNFLKNGCFLNELASSELESLAVLPSVFWNLLEQTGVPQLFSKEFVKLYGVDASKAASVMILNYALERCSKNKLGDWFAKTMLKHDFNIRPEKLNKDLLCRTLDFFTEAKIEELHAEVFRNLKTRFGLKDGLLFYDLTQVTFEGKSCELVKRGRNSVKHFPFQISLGLAVTSDKIPVSHKVFDGSVKDVSTFGKVFALVTNTVNPEKTVFVLDRGLASDNNFSLIELKKAGYITGLPKNKSWQNKIAGVWDDAFTKVDEDLSFHEFEGRLGKNGSIRRTIVFWSKKLAEEQRVLREKKLAKASRNLRRLKKNLLRYSQDRLREKVGQITNGVRPFYEINYEKGLSFELSESKMALAERVDGKYLIITNTKMFAGEILEKYRDRNFVEMSFKDLKLFVDIGPVRHWKDQRVLAHVFLSVLAFALRSLAELKLRRAKVDLTCQAAVENLSSVRALACGGRVLRLTGETEETKKIVEVLKK